MFFWAIVGLLLCALLVLYWSDIESAYLKAGAAAFLATIFFGICLGIFNGQRHLKSLARSLLYPFAELESLNNYLSDYLEELYKRTSKYFHAVTNTKVTAYFVLNQMNDALKARVGEGTSLMDNPTRRNIHRAYFLLQKPLRFSDGAVATAGNIHHIPLRRLNSALSQLIGNLERGIEAMEEEQKEAKSYYQDDGGEEEGE